MKFFETIKSFLKTLYKQRYIMYTLVIRDFKSRYLSSYLGLPWAFIQPATYVLVIWFAFSVGIRGGGGSSLRDGVPYVAFLITGLVPWLFINKTLVVSSSSIVQYAYLIKKTDFPVSMIPIIKILSGMIVHIFLVIFMMLLLIFAYNIPPTIYWIQIFYYQFVLIFLFSGISWIAASINVFVKDMEHIINIIVTMLFWATPILWPYSRLHGNYKYLALLNPFFYITEGYRYTFIENTWFFKYAEFNIFFWSVSIAIFLTGIYTFQKLKPDFGDVL